MKTVTVHKKHGYFKLLLHRDTIIATLFSLLCIWSISHFVKMHILEPGKSEQYDQDYTDLIFKHSTTNKFDLNNPIIIINVDKAERGEIGDLLIKVDSLHPLAIGLDVFFKSSSDSVADNKLAAAINTTHNLVIASILGNVRGKIETGYFDGTAHNTGFVNYYGQQQDVIRYFSPFIKGKSSFSAEIVRLAAPKQHNILLGRDNEIETVNYTLRNDDILTIDYKAFLEGTIKEGFLKNKIVLIGYISADTNNIEDKHYTPMNPVFWERALPDMNGIVVQANTINMILNNAYIHIVPDFFNISFAIIFCWLFIGLCIRYIVNQHIWFHVVIRLVQVLLVFFVIFMQIFFFNYFRIKFDSAAAILVVIFSVEFLFLYEIIAKKMHNKFKHKTIFEH